MRRAPRPPTGRAAARRCRPWPSWPANRRRPAVAGPRRPSRRAPGRSGHACRRPSRCHGGRGGVDQHQRTGVDGEGIPRSAHAREFGRPTAVRSHAVEDGGSPVEVADDEVVDRLERRDVVDCVERRFQGAEQVDKAILLDGLEGEVVDGGVELPGDAGRAVGRHRRARRARRQQGRPRPRPRRGAGGSRHRGMHRAATVRTPPRGGRRGPGRGAHPTGASRHGALDRSPSRWPPATRCRRCLWTSSRTAARPPTRHAGAKERG